MVLFQQSILLYELHAMGSCGRPIVLQALKEIQLVTSFTLEIDGKPLKELSLPDEHVREVFVVNGAVNDDFDLVVCETNFGLQLLQFGVERFVVVDLDPFLGLQGDVHHLFLLFEITSGFLPNSDFLKNGLDVVNWLFNSFFKFEKLLVPFVCFFVRHSVLQKNCLVQCN